MTPIGRLGPPVRLPQVAAALTRHAGTVAGRLARAAGLTARGVWSRPGRHHIEVRGICQPGSEHLARDVEIALERIPGVAWARVNAPSGRVVVAVEKPEPRLRDLIATVARVERHSDHEIDHDLPETHPPEEGPRTRRAVGTIAADAFGLTLSALTRILPFTPLPREVSGLLSAVDLHPRLHALVDRGLPRTQQADSWFPLAEAIVQGLTGGWAAIVLDGAQRIVQWQEARAQQAAWGAAEPRLTGTPGCAAAGPPTAERPRPTPDGPVERYNSRVLAAGAAAAAVALPLVGRKRAAALGLATVPKAPRAGREGYAAHLGRILAKRGVVAMDRNVLRELDRIDTVVVDAAVLRSGQGTLTDLVPLDGADPEETVVRAYALFDPAQPDKVHEADGWRLGPLDQLSRADDQSGGEPTPAGGRPVDTTAAHAHLERLGDSGWPVLGLVDGDRLVAALRVDALPRPGADSLAAATRTAGLRLVVATEDPTESATTRYRYADLVVPGGGQLADSVRDLQADGAMVLLVSSDRTALAAADCGLGVGGEDDPPPWGAHLLVGADLRVPALVIEATGAARNLVRQSIGLAAAGAGLGSLGAFTAAPEHLPARTLAAVNGAAGLAFAHGVWRAHRLHDHAEAPTTATTPWHLMPVDVVLRQLATSIDGLSAAEVDRRRTDVTPSGPPGGGLLGAFVDELANPLTPILAAGAALSAAFGSWVDAALVSGVISASALVGAGHRVNTERALTELLSRSAVTTNVRRDGVEQSVPAEELVVGDIVLLRAGDAVPADCRIVEATGLEADESSLTGESLPVVKAPPPVVTASVAERRSMLYEGTTVAAGQATAVVVATGNDTEAGRSMAMARQEPPRGGVEARLGRLTRTAIPLAATSAIAVAGAGLLRGVPLAETAATAANLAVASVPEGLPFLVGAAQLAAARRLAEHGALVRNPRTIEALGRVDVLCFDKTGTLTEGQLRLAGVGDGDRYASTDALDDRLRAVLSAAVRATPEAERPEQLTQQTDRAVLLGAIEAGVDATTTVPRWRANGDLPFEASRSYHATVGAGSGRSLLSVKGAPETVLPRCVARRGPDGDRPLDEDDRTALREAVTRHAAAGHRILVVAERPWSRVDISDSDVQGLVFLGFLALADGVRSSAAPAVRQIRAAGVHTIMITGDHPATAAAIAATISPDDGEQRVVTAAELEALDNAALAARLAETDVVARCTPTHKVRIIQALQEQGRTVAMTGDGANDAPAIRLADVGIALGRRGTPAARAAADLVVTDDRLETIIATLVEGRALWSSVRHALGILVGGNLGEIAFSVLTAATTGRSALTGRQLLLVNLLTDLAPAMAIAVRPPHAEHATDLLTEGPDTSLGSTLSQEIALRAAATTLGATTGWTLARYTGRRRRAGTVALAALVGTQLGQTVLAGGASPSVLISTATSVGALVGVVQTPGLSQFFGCTPLGPVGWTIAAGSAVGATLANGAVSRLLSRLPASPPAESPGDPPPSGAPSVEEPGSPGGPTPAMGRDQPVIGEPE